MDGRCCDDAMLAQDGVVVYDNESCTILVCPHNQAWMVLKDEDGRVARMYHERRWLAVGLKDAMALNDLLRSQTERLEASNEELRFSVASILAGLTDLAPHAARARGILRTVDGDGPTRRTASGPSAQGPAGPTPPAPSTA